MLNLSHTIQCLLEYVPLTIVSGAIKFSLIFHKIWIAVY